jgi:Cu-Zn family superoxide dismutase
MIGRHVKWTRVVAIGLMAILLTSCACTDPNKIAVADSDSDENKEIADATQSNSSLLMAVATLKPVEKNDVRGTVTFTQVNQGVKIVAELEGLKPGKHGFHIHEHGSCGGKEAAEAGSHYNPTHSEHGSPDRSTRHIGDLGNLIADENGHAHYERIDRAIKLTGPDSIIGRTVIVHADEDDLVTQPAGASGAKISCGVIERVSVQ